MAVADYVNLEVRVWGASQTPAEIQGLVETALASVGTSRTVGIVQSTPRTPRTGATPCVLPGASGGLEISSVPVEAGAGPATERSQDLGRVARMLELEAYALLSPAEVDILNSCHQQVWDEQPLSERQRWVVDRILGSSRRQERLEEARGRSFPGSS